MCIGLARQKRGDTEGGPIGPALKAMSIPVDGEPPVSIVGLELAKLIRGRGVWVAFGPTGGDGAAPWIGLVLFDGSLKGEGQIATHYHVSLVAHELAHVLQRDHGDGYFWPSGLFSIRRFTRWVTDSTNYMEVLAYIVGFIVEYDLWERGLESPGLTDEEKEDIKNKQDRITDHLATLTGPDQRKATRYILQTRSKNPFYQQNYRKEHTTDDMRIPPGGWDTWLIRFGFSRDAVEHIRQIALKGKKQSVDQKYTDEKADVESIYGGRRRRITKSFIKLAINEMERRLDLSLSTTAVWIVLFTLIHSRIALTIANQSIWIQDLYAGVQWLWWFVLGVLVVTVSSIDRTIRDHSSESAPPAFDWLNSILVGLVTAFLFVLLLRAQVTLTLDLTVAYTALMIEGARVVSLPFLAFTTGFFYQLVGQFVRTLRKLITDGLTSPIFHTIRKIIKGESYEEHSS